VSLIACNVIKASAVRDERTPDLIGFLNLIILSEIELNMAVAKEHEDEIKALLKDSKDLQAILAEFDKARDKKKKQPKIDPGEVKAHFDKIIEKARADEYLKESGVPAYVVSASWIRSFEEGAIEPINSLELI
jgi:predicted phage-related endonuclease